ncbi:MAG: N-acetyl-gamma-glutamyl-phosphate reductase [Oscillospiraceae bacterium]|nr:N-acetyl-gamma-glutamyl-phosphate reductase [Oscillospiraceae bacterium]
MSVKVYIDGQAGTTGLKIVSRLEQREDITLLKIAEQDRHNSKKRAEIMAESDFTFLCLPDDAAREAVALADGNTRLIDASTAHRTNPAWAYGFPELAPEFREKLQDSRRTAVPGCYASGFISLLYPMVKHELIPADFPVFSYATSGYSGAGKNAIVIYEGEDKPEEFYSPRQYALSQQHKHLPEMQLFSGLTCKPMFNPIICDYYSGMVVSVPIQTRMLDQKISLEQVNATLQEHYADAKLVTVNPVLSEQEQKSFFLASNTLSGKNKLEIFTFGNDEQILLCARLDNLGKGASGAAVQCLNIMMGIDETTGLL